MKKLILPLVAVLAFSISIYTVTSYNKNKSKDLGITTNENFKTNNATPNVSSTPDKNSASNINSSTKKSILTDKLATINFKLKDLSGNEVSLSDFKGKKVFLNFWATWCPPCKAEMPDIENLYNETKDSDLIILAVNIGDDKNTTKSFIDKNKYGFTVLLDLDQSVAAQYNIAAIPTSFFIDKEGNIVTSIKGGMTMEEMKNYISKL